MATCRVRRFHGHPCRRSHCSTSSLPVAAAISHALSSSSHPLPAAHSSTGMWPFLAAHEVVRESHGHPFSLSHTSTERCPPSAADPQVCSLHSYPSPLSHWSAASCPALAAAEQAHEYIILPESPPCDAHSKMRMCPYLAAHTTHMWRSTSPMPFLSTQSSTARCPCRKASITAICIAHLVCGHRLSLSHSSTWTWPLPAAAEYESELHGLNQPALTLSDVVNAGGGGTLPRVVVSKMNKVENGGLRITSTAVEVSITNKLDGTCDLAWQWDDGSQATDNWTNVEVELTFDITLAESETREGSLLELIVGADTPHALIVQQHCARTAGRAAEGGSMPVSDMLAIAKEIFPALLDERLGQRPSQKKKKDAAQYFLSLLNEELASFVRVKGEPFIIPADAAGSASAIAALVRSFNSKGSGLSAGPSPAAWPRCHAIWKRAMDQESFDVAVSECMAACLSGNMLDTVRRHSRSMLNELERKLTAVGSRGSAAAVEAYAGIGAEAGDLMDAEAVIAMVFDMLAPQGTAAQLSQTKPTPA